MNLTSILILKTTTELASHIDMMRTRLFDKEEIKVLWKQMDSAHTQRSLLTEPSSYVEEVVFKSIDQHLRQAQLDLLEREAWLNSES